MKNLETQTKRLDNVQTTVLFVAFVIFVILLLV